MRRGRHGGLRAHNLDAAHGQGCTRGRPASCWASAPAVPSPSINAKLTGAQHSDAARMARPAALCQHALAHDMQCVVHVTHRACSVAQHWHLPMRTSTSGEQGLTAMHRAGSSTPLTIRLSEDLRPVNTAFRSSGRLLNSGELRNTDSLQVCQEQSRLAAARVVACCGPRNMHSAAPWQHSKQVGVGRVDGRLAAGGKHAAKVGIGCQGDGLQGGGRGLQPFTPYGST